MSKNKYKVVKKILWVILLANFLVAVLKIIIGNSCSSQSVISDGIHSFADGASNVIGLIGIWLASKPRDKNHQYGHDKYEILASLTIGITLAIMSIRIMWQAVSSFGNSSLIEINFLEGLLMVLTIIINSIVAFSEFQCGKKINSVILITDSLHTRGDILISSAVLLGLIGIRVGLPVWVDALMSIGVAVVVLSSAGKIIKNCVDVLVDSTVVDGDEVSKLLMNLPGVHDIHNVRSRGESSHIFIDLHVIVSPTADTVFIHELSHEIEAILQEQFGPNTEVNVHTEPDDGFHCKENKSN